MTISAPEQLQEKQPLGNAPKMVALVHMYVLTKWGCVPEAVATVLIMVVLVVVVFMLVYNVQIVQDIVECHGVEM